MSNLVSGEAVKYSCCGGSGSWYGSIVLHVINRLRWSVLNDEVIAQGLWTARKDRWMNGLPWWYLVRVLDVADLLSGEFLVCPIRSVISLECFGNVFVFPTSEYARENVIDLLGKVFAILRHGEEKRKETRETLAEIWGFVFFFRSFFVCCSVM